jgi:hypothetical protein
MLVASSPLGSLFVLGILVLIGGHTFFLIRRGRWLALDPLNSFWGGVLAVYVLQPVQFADVLARWHAPGIMEWTLGLSLLAFTGVVVGYEATWGTAWGHSLPRMPARLNAQRLTLVALALMALGFVGYGYLIGTAGSFWEWIAVPRGGTNWAAVNGYIATLIYFLPLGIALLLFRVNLWRTPQWMVVLVWTLQGLITLWSLYIGSRSQLIGNVLTGFGAFYLPRRRNPPVWLMAVTFLVLTITVSFMGAYRENFTNLSFNLDQMDLQEVEQRVLPEFLGGSARVKKSDVATGNDFNCVMAAVELVPAEVDFNYGECLLEFLTRPIPRALWPDKSYPHYEAFTPIYDRARLSSWVVPSARRLILAGPAFTFVGHWYAVGGPVVLIIAGVLTGCFFRMIRTVYNRSAASQGDKILYLFLMPIGFSEAAATPLFWVFSIGIFLVPLAALLYVCRESVEPLAQPQRSSRPSRPLVEKIPAACIGKSA